MTTEKIHLYQDNPLVTLTSYIASPSPEMPNRQKRKAILVLPGGGYGMCSDREAEPIAKTYFAAGLNAFVLRYSVGEKAIYPQPLLDVSLSMKYIRDNAERFQIDPDKVFVIGFSAGGHLAGAIGTLWHKDYIYDRLDIPYGINKPNGMILSYPVLVANEFAHEVSIYNILGTTNPTKEQLDLYSIEKHVDENTIPAFLWHTADDNGVPVENTLMMAKALSANKIPFEVHIFPNGPHGISLASEETCSGNPNFINPHIANWVKLSIEWIETL